MIRYRAIGYVLGQLLLIFAGTMTVPMAWSLWAGDNSTAPLGWALIITLAVGGVAVRATGKPHRELTRREGLLLTVAAWLAICLFGSLPFAFSPYFGGFTDAFFESVSGFTTTGATILEDVEGLPPGLQFWRCFSQWLGGMGIVLLGVAVLPLVGHGGMELYRAEFSGAASEKLKPRITETAMSLWRIYFAMSAVLFGLLRLAGMNSFEALCHTFTTMGTGGFSTRNGSIGDFQSPLIEYILISFMLLAGASFVQHYRCWVERRPASALRDIETRGYLALAAVAVLAIAVVLLGTGDYSGEQAFRSAAFQVSAILTTTGFSTDDFELWRPLPQLLLLVLMFVGGSTGSTAGGLKVARVLLLAKVVDREFKRMVEPRGVFSVRLGMATVHEATIQGLLNLVYLALVVNFASCLLLASMGVDVLTSISAVAASMFTIGPGLGAVGPTDTYAALPGAAKWVLASNMIAGRLEFYTLIVLLTPTFWRR